MSAHIDATTTAKLVSIESPFRAMAFVDQCRNFDYAERAFHHSISLGESPFASHLFYTSILDDNNPEQRALGLRLSHSWRARAQLIAFYTDLGMSEGMRAAQAIAERYSIPTTFRTIGL